MRFSFATRSAAACAILLWSMSGSAAGSPDPHALTQGDLQAFFDGIIPLQLERGDIAGASVLVMKDGETLLQKGYGFSDMKSKQPVDPASTIFRLASISKLFTWTAAMQLVEEGKLDLDVDISRYLDFPIKSNSGITAPITLRNLMTHTGGFEETGRNIIVTSDEHYLGLRDFLIQNQPHRLFAPGTVAAYSNYGVGLGSYIVQRVSGEPFEQYVAEHIFVPLGMSHSTFLQPPPKALENLPSQGYSSSTRQPAVGFERFSPVGAGGLSSTAADMGRFGQALLNGGELDGHRILRRETLETMWQPQFRASDALPPLGLGFYQVWRNDLKWIGHQGDLVAFHSLFFVEPRNKLVLFISYNSAGSASKTRTELLNGFSDRYFPKLLQQTFSNTPRKELLDVEGVYEPTRRADSTQFKLMGLFAQRHAAIDKDGVLHVDKIKDLRGHPIAWKPAGKDLWQEVDEQGTLFAIRGSDGRVARLAGVFAGAQMQRVPWYERDYVMLPLLAVSLTIVFSVFLALIFRLARRFLFRSSQPVAPPGTTALNGVSKAAAIYWFVLFTALAAVFRIVGNDDALPPTSAWDKYFLLADVLSAVAIGLSAFAVASTIAVWRLPAVRRMSQIKYTLVAIACVFLTWFVLHWNVLGPIHRL